MRVLLVQLPIPPAGPEPIRGNVPLAAAYLHLVARRRGLEAHFDFEILPADEANRLGDAALVEAVCAREPAILGLTCYLWNVDRSLWLARQVKERLPGCLVVVGGPEITSDNDWVLADPSLDFAVFGEGEQTFGEWLAWMAAGAQRDHLPRIAGLGWRDGASWRSNLPRVPMHDLAEISSPYLEGILDAGDQEQLLLETVRGCVFRCKFCYYPKAYDSQHLLPDEHVLQNLAHARARGVKEVYLLDPTLNQRPDFREFVELLVRGNPDGSLELHGELRGEGLNEAVAARMRAAHFVEVELGLQSVDAKTQALMDRRNNLRAFEKGVRALRGQGIRVKADLIVGLPGDTPETVRQGMHFLRDQDLCDMAQVFRLGILPGTAFRHEAEELGLVFDPRPPYFVRSTPTLSEHDIEELLAEAEDIFDCTFDPLPPAWATEPGRGGAVLDLDAGDAEHWQPPADADHVFSITFQVADPFASLDAMTAVVRRFLAANPFALLQLVLETGSEFPLDVVEALLDAGRRGERVYLERWLEHEAQAATRIVVRVAAGHDEMPDRGWCDAVTATGALLVGR